MVPCTLLTDNFYEIREISYSLPVKHQTKKCGPSEEKLKIQAGLEVQNQDNYHLEIFIQITTQL